MNYLTVCKVTRMIALVLILLSTIHGSFSDFKTIMASAEVRATLQHMILKPVLNISANASGSLRSPCQHNAQTNTSHCVFNTQPIDIIVDSKPLLLELTRNSRGEWVCAMQTPDLRAPDACHVTSQTQLNNH